MSPITVAIMAGGKSSRMGTDKAFVKVLGRPLIEDLVENLSGLGQEMILITNQPDGYRYLGLPLFSDVWPDKGALGGIYTALHHSTQPRTLCVACDMPFINRPLLEYLIALSVEGDAIVPRLNGEAEPFRAVYAREACLGPIRAALEANRMRIISFFPQVRVRWVEQPEVEQFDPRHLSFFNVNTPEDLIEARRLAQTP
jgi:molybdopterin-guanine dinucleotide biosynthesis protein A